MITEAALRHSVSLQWKGVLAEGSLKPGNEIGKRRLVARK